MIAHICPLPHFGIQSTSHLDDLPSLGHFLPASTIDLRKGLRDATARWRADSKFTKGSTI